MQSKPAKVLIKEMKYLKDSHLFLIKLWNIELEQQACISINASDFGIPSGTSMDLISKFCKEMEGKEKNLYIYIESETKKYKDMNIEDMLQDRKSVV